MSEQPQTAGGTFLSNVIAIIASIIVIAIVIWGLVHLVSMSNGWFASLFNWATPKSGATIVVSAPREAESGIPMNISWKFSPTVAGTYAILYQCRSGLSLQAMTPDNKLFTIPCGAGYTVGTKNQSASVIPVLSGTTTAPLPISIFFMPSSTSSVALQAHGSATVTVYEKGYTSTYAGASSPVTQTPVTQPTMPVPVVGAVTVPATTGSNEPSYQPAKTVPVQHPTHVYRGPADISVRVIAVGVIDPYGRFIARPANPGEIVAAQFDIKNVGGETSGPYSFHAQLPTQDHFIYVSPLQRPLAPGSHVVNTLRFSEVNPNGGSFSVNVAAIGSDAQEANNSAAVWVNGAPVSYYPQPIPQPAPYPTTDGYYGNYSSPVPQSTTYPANGYYGTYPTYTY